MSPMLSVISIIIIRKVVIISRYKYWRSVVVKVPSTAGRRCQLQLALFIDRRKKCLQQNRPAFSQDEVLPLYSLPNRYRTLKAFFCLSLTLSINRVFALGKPLSLV